VNVLHVIPSVAARYGGPSHAIGPMCRALAAHGVRTTILTTNADGPHRLPVPLGSLTEWEGVPAVFFNRDTSEAFKYSRGLARWARGHVRDFDVVHIHAVLSHASLTAAASSYRHGVPYVMRPLGTLAPWSLGQKSWRKRVLLTVAARRTVANAAAIHCTSEEEKRGIEIAFPEARPLVIPLGIDPRFLEGASVPDVARPYVLSVSRLHPKKNLETLIDAFLDVTADRPEWRLVIAGAGDPEYTRQLTQFIEARGAAGRVELAGWVDGPRKRTLMQRASLFALVSMHENFGISLLEALACGVPAVATRNVDLSEPIAHAGAGWIVEPSRHSVKEGLTAALSAHDGLAARGLAAKQLATRFTWPSIAAELSMMYSRISQSLIADASTRPARATADPAARRRI
jgi:glycosyltransferase involved in cell wall biosynthesis